MLTFTPDEETKRLIQILRKKGFLENSQALLRFIVDRVIQARISEVAASMALTSILAMVPLLALSTAFFSSFPGFASMREELEVLVLSTMLPDQYSDVLLGYFQQFSRHAVGLTTFGIVGLAVTAFVLLYRLFSALDFIFKINTPRPLSQRILIFWALLSTGPLAIAASVSMGAHVTGLVLQGIDPGTSRLFYTLGQVGLQTMIFALIYKLVPNCRVNFLHALIGGLFVTLINQCVKDIFSLYLATGTLGNVYGTFVAIPVFILWIYIAWLLFLTGATITATIPLLVAGRYSDQFKVGNDFFSAIKMLKVFTQMRANRQRPILRVFDLCQAAETNPENARKILGQLESIQYVSPINRNQKQEMWALIADSKNDTLRPVFECFCLNPKNTTLLRDRKDKENSLNIWWNRFVSTEALNEPLQTALLDKKELT